MRGVWTGRGGAAGNLSPTHAAKNKKWPWNVWPSPKSLPPPSARAPSLGEKQEAPILWNKFLLMWTCWWGLKGGRWTHMTIRIHFTAFIADCVTVCCFWGLRWTEFLANRSSQTPAVQHVWCTWPRKVSHCPSSVLYFALEVWKQNPTSVCP